MKDLKDWYSKINNANYVQQKPHFMFPYYVQTYSKRKLDIITLGLEESVD